MRSPATYIALVALVVSLAGGAVAATYVITSPKQIKPRVITGKHVKKGSLGPELLKGGSASVTVRKAEGTIPAGGQEKVKASCQDGEKATGGGYENAGPIVLASKPDPEEGTPTAWVVEAYDGSVPPSDTKQPVFVVCTK
jgi:hypothetical protein